MVPPANTGRPPGRSPRNQYTSSRNGTSAPLGIKILCVVGALVALYGLFTALQIMAAGGPFTVLGLLFVLLFAGYGAVLYGLWTVKPWGWTWGMIVFAIDALFDLVQLNIIGLLISILLLAYLYSKRDVYR